MLRVFRLAAFAALLALIVAAPAVAQDDPLVLEGRIASEQPDWVEVPFDVPPGTTRVNVSYSYDREGNALDIGVLDPRGPRGYSGGARSEFTLAASDATPGYRPGPIEPGRWAILLGPYTVAPSGLKYRVEVRFSNAPTGPAFKPRPAPERLPGRGWDWYRGDLHVHTEHSDGRFSQRDVIDRARTGGLDFVFSTEHNTDSASLSWGAVARPDLLIGNGAEVTTRGGHWNAIGLPPNKVIDWRYRPGEAGLENALRDVRQAGGLAVVNHPTAACKACGWGFPYSGMDAIEVWQGPWNPLNDQALLLWDRQLRAGSRITAIGASDAHRDPQVIGEPQTVVGADAAGTPEIVAALRRGRAYIARNANIEADLRARSRRAVALPGDTLRGGRRALATLRVRGVKGGVATFVTDSGKRLVRPIARDEQLVAAPVRGARWIRAEVRDGDGTMAALTNPIWLEP